MKLSIRSNIVSEINSLLCDTEYGSITPQYRIFFGKMFRTGFIPFLNTFDYKNILKKLDEEYEKEYENKIIKTKNIIPYLNIGLISNQFIVMGTTQSEETQSEETLYSSLDKSHHIALIKNQEESYSLEIIFIIKPQNIPSFFKPIKYLLQIFSNTFEKVQNKNNIIVEYNSLFGKNKNIPLIIRQPLKRISESFIPDLENYLAFPITRGKKYTLFLCELGAYLISRNNILKIDETVPPQFYNTILTGDFYEKSFYCYDAIMIGGYDVRRFSLIRRRRDLNTIVTQFPFFCIIQEDSTESIISKYNGVLYIPNRANFMNKRRYIYQPVDKIGIHFKVCSVKTNGYLVYVLKTGNKQQVFTGTDLYPSYDTIPLSQEDREFIGPDNEIFEFRWMNDGFVPFSYSCTTTSFKQSKNLWKNINEPLNSTELLRTFKKIKTH
jgi:hypothetical protein